jgi:hypothetical protein
MGDSPTGWVGRDSLPLKPQPVEMADSKGTWSPGGENGETPCISPSATDGGAWSLF